MPESVTKQGNSFHGRYNFIKMEKQNLCGELNIEQWELIIYL
jgi:hypothetical protein